MIWRSITVIALALLPAVATAQIPPPLKVQKPQMVCREDEQPVGTHIHAGRKCRTAEQWLQEDAARRQKPPSMRVTEGQDAGKQRPPW